MASSQAASVGDPDQQQAGTSGSSTSWPAGEVASAPQQVMSGGSQQELSSAGQAAGSSASEGNRGKAREYHPRAPEPPYAVAYAYRIWPSKAFRNYKLRPDFLEAFPVPAGKTFNVNSFLGPKDAQKGQYYVPQVGVTRKCRHAAPALGTGCTVARRNHLQACFRVTWLKAVPHF